MTTSDTDEDARTVRPFASFLQEHNKGSGHRKASEALQRVVQAVQETQKKGSVTLTVHIDPMKGTDDALLTTVVVTEKVPVLPERAAVFYADDDGNLTRTDPNQLPFEGLKEVAGPVLHDAPAPARVVGGDSE